MTTTKPNILLTPGPTPVPPEVLEIMSRPIFHHRTPQFRSVLKQLQEGLKYVFQTKQDVYTICASGTGGMEASIVNFFSPGDHVIAVNSGKFGERWVKMAQAFGLKCDVISVEWGKAVDPIDIKKQLDAPTGKDIKGVFTTLCETSTGVLTDIKAIAQITKNYQALLIVDAISALGGEDCKMDEWGIDIVITGSQKALMIPPGLAFVAASQKAWNRAKDANLTKFYLDLKKYQKSLLEEDVPFTPAITLVLAQVEALRQFKEDGYDKVIHRAKKLAEATRKATQAMGLKTYSKAPSNVLTTIELPASVDGSKLVKMMRDELGVTVAGGQDHLKGKVIRIAHMGFIRPQDLATGFKIFGEALARQGYQCDVTKAVEQFKNL
ncbi:MAG: alanine--glyoxylate aminotransferase family protein [Candidatus Omnitrophica bacterium]|nr:alanine--glyoxylate aminotransferase family protein [Candidatus Omnitrophota bacterium]